MSAGQGPLSLPVQIRRRKKHYVIRVPKRRTAIGQYLAAHASSPLQRVPAVCLRPWVRHARRVFGIMQKRPEEVGVR